MFWLPWSRKVSTLSPNPPRHYANRSLSLPGLTTYHALSWEPVPILKGHVFLFGEKTPAG